MKTANRAIREALQSEPQSQKRKWLTRIAITLFWVVVYAMMHHIGYRKGISAGRIEMIQQYEARIRNIEIGMCTIDDSEIL